MVYAVQVDVNLDEEVLNLLFGFINLDLDNLSPAYEQTAFEDVIADVYADSDADTETKACYFELLHVNPIKINLTFASSPGIGALHIWKAVVTVTPCCVAG